MFCIEAGNELPTCYFRCDRGRGRIRSFSVRLGRRLKLLSSEIKIRGANKTVRR